MLKRKISIEELEEGMLIAEDVFTGGGVIIVPANTTVTIEVLNLLARHSILEVVMGEETDDSDLSMEDFGILDGALSMLDYLEEREKKQNTFEDVFCAAEQELEAGIKRLVNKEETKPLPAPFARRPKPKPLLSQVFPKKIGTQHLRILFLKISHTMKSAPQAEAVCL